MVGYLPVCRVCLAINVNLLPIADTPLQFVYERLTSSLLHTIDIRPLTACYMCYALLRKSYTLMLKSVTANNLLSDIFKRNSKITKRSVSLVDRKANKLSRSLEMSTPECIDFIPRTAVTAKPNQHTPPPGSGTPGNASPTPGPAVKRKIEEEPDIKTEYVFEEMEASPSPPAIEPPAMDVANAVDMNNGKVSETHQPLRKMELSCDEPGMSAEQTEKETHLVAEDPTSTQQTSRLSIPRVPGAKIYECIVCHNQFKHKQVYENHLRTHTGEKPFECHICGRKFSVRTNLNIHVKTHTSEKPFQCVLCGSQYRRVEHLKIHIASHSGEKPFQCIVCNRRFARKFHLKRHSIIHTGEKLFECNVCQRRFSTNDKLQIHLRKHSSEKLYSCDVCKRGFKAKATLKSHLIINNGNEVFKCKKCKRDYHYKTRKGQLRMCKQCCLKNKRKLNIT